MTSQQSTEAIPGTPSIDDLATARRQAARELTQLMSSQRPFSFLRLGDGEVNWMLRMQGDDNVPRLRYNYPESRIASVEVAYSVTGLEPRHYERLLAAYNHCTYLDLYNGRQDVRERLPRLGLERAPELHQNTSPETSIIFYEWTYYEMGNYLSNRRCAFAGGESPLLEALWNDPEYRRIAARYWPDDAQPFFTNVRENGRNYSENLDSIKDDLKRYVEANQIDTLFLSLATGAKIIGYELSQEMSICCYDFGSITRGLSYAATPGYHAMRASHNPFFVRVPLPVYIKAIDRAHPDLNEVEKAAKAQAQLCLDLQRREVMKSSTTDANNAQSFAPTPNNLRVFRANLRYYNEKFGPLFAVNPQARQLDREFRHWCRKKGLGLDGRIFQYLVKIKGSFRRVKSNILGSLKK